MQTARGPVLVAAQPETSPAPVEVEIDVAPAKSFRDGEVRDVRREMAHARRRPWRRMVSLGILVAAGAGVARQLDTVARAAARRRRRRTTAGLLVGTAALGAALVRWQLARLFTEEPAYTVELKDGDFEIRRYAPLVLAKTPVDGPWARALDEGFRRLADYIFAKANVRRDPRTLLASLDHARQKLSMTTPVVAAREGEHHVVSFVMPGSETIETLPIPTDPRVRLEHIDTQRVAVLRFHGHYDAATIRTKQEELFERATHAGLTPIGDPEFVAYDAPWTLPKLRRVEVWIPIA